MNFFQILFVAVLVASAYAGLIKPRDPTLSQFTINRPNEELPQLTRNRRWIISWLMTHGSLMNSLFNKTEEANTNPEALGRSDLESSIEVHNLPISRGYSDLSDDTRVNYMNGQGRRASLAHEGDAEVFDWNLLQDDRVRNTHNVNPHYYEFHAREEDRNSAAMKETYENLYGRPYGVTERTNSGFMRVSGSNSGIRIKPFNRTPIAYRDSLEFRNSATRAPPRRA